MEAGIPTPDIDDEIIAPALWLVGELWERGDISVADEHLATEISLRVLALQREARRVASSRAGVNVMLAAPSGEHHVVALRMLAGLLLNAGYDTLMLGPDVPPESLAGEPFVLYQADITASEIHVRGSDFGDGTGADQRVPVQLAG